jgi:excisionase family DNA binding protein
MNQEIKPHSVYTTSEIEGLLRVSESTVKRLLKKGIIRANKIGKQYRILGKEVLRLVSPDFERQAEKTYMEVKTKAVRKLNKW